MNLVLRELISSRLDNEASVLKSTEICAALPSASSKCVLDLTGCIIDYPYTARVIDNFIDKTVQMRCSDLRVLIDFDFPDYILLNLVFRQGKFWPESSSKDDFLSKIANFQTENAIKIALDVVDSSKILVRSILS